MNEKLEWKRKNKRKGTTEWHGESPNVGTNRSCSSAGQMLKKKSLHPLIALALWASLWYSIYWYLRNIVCTPKTVWSSLQKSSTNMNEKLGCERKIRVSALPKHCRIPLAEKINIFWLHMEGYAGSISCIILSCFCPVTTCDLSVHVCVLFSWWLAKDCLHLHIYPSITRDIHWLLERRATFPTRRILFSFVVTAIAPLLSIH